MKRRFRASLYLDFDIDSDKSINSCRQDITRRLIKLRDILGSPEEYCIDDLINMKYYNPRVGGVAHYTPDNLIEPLDKEI
ncbi:MAG: hypothetical protein ACOC1K_05675 [Nanoarchaeota archaeon]